MKKYIIFTLLSCFTLFSCVREELDEMAGAPADANGLIITATCDEMVKTDMTQGKSTWEAGDEITVVYNGKSYAYKTTTGGATAVFTSTAGIQEYNAAYSIVAYYPATTTPGTVSVAAERNIGFSGSTQTMTSKAPLVGTPNAVATNGNLALGFRNICSVLELCIDGGLITDAAKKLTIKPASAAGFEGYLSFTGTVNEKTREITTTATGNTLVLNFPSGTALTKAMTLKLPVGRFKASDGLVLEMETSSGKVYKKTIYRGGLQSYTVVSGNYVAKHFAKPLYAFAEVGKGITNATELMAFAKAVNEGGDLSPYQDNEGVVFLANHIDMSSVTSWTPIGVCKAELTGNSLTMSGKPFQGTFDGRGFEIRNFKMVCNNAEAASPWGFFGGLDEGATVTNLTFASSCSLTVSPSVQTDCGILAGMVRGAKVSRILNNAPMNYTNATVEDGVRMTMGIIGSMFSENVDTQLDSLINRGAITVKRGNNTQNNANSVQVGGICGFSTTATNSTHINYVRRCINYGNMNTDNGRTSGLVASCQRSTHILNCENRGNHISSSPSARLGNLTCITGTGSVVMDSANYGDLISSESQPVGGCICLINHADNCFTRMANYGRVVSDRTSGYTGTLFGQCNNGATFVNCIAAGNYGTYNGGSYSLVGITKNNYFDYVGTHNASATGVTTANITYDGKVTVPSSISILAIGNSFSVDAMEYLYDILVNAGVTNVTLGNLYRPGCNLATHYSHFQKDSTIYTYYKNTTGAWTNKKNVAPLTALKERSWDYICMQQSSPLSGKADTYDPYMSDIITIVKKHCSSSKLMWHMTWAYQANSTHSAFPDYNSNQMTMYNAIISATKSKILTNKNFVMVIPCATSIQNVRTSYIGDVLTRDGYHLSYREGRFITALTWAAKILNCDLSKITYKPADYTYSSKDISAIKEGVKNAIDNPFVVTQSTY